MKELDEGYQNENGIDAHNLTRCICLPTGSPVSPALHVTVSEFGEIEIISEQDNLQVILESCETDTRVAEGRMSIVKAPYERKGNIFEYVDQRRDYIGEVAEVESAFRTGEVPHDMPLWCSAKRKFIRVFYASNDGRRLRKNSIRVCYRSDSNSYRCDTCGMVIARHPLRPIDQMTSVALRSHGPGHFGHLARTFDEMLDQLKTSFERVRDLANKKGQRR